MSRLCKSDPLHHRYVFEERNHNRVLGFVITSIKEKCRSFDFRQVRDDSPILQWSSDIELARTITADK
jgi:hypothetical protein